MHQSNLLTKLDFKRGLLYASLFASFIFAYWPVWQGLVGTWYTSEDYSHGFLVLPICAYILWSKRALLAATPIRSARWGLALLVASLLLYLAGHLAEIRTVQSLSLVMTTAGLVLCLLGYAFFKAIWFPLLLLLFMIPVPAQIYAKLTIPLQLLVTTISTGAARLMDIPVFRNGNVIHLPERTLEVVQACSGLRSLLSLLFLSAIFSYFTLRSFFSRMLLIAMGVPAAIVVNIFRVVLMIIAFYYFNFDLTTGPVHTVFGALIFILALALVAGAGKVLSAWEASVRSE